MQPIEPKNRERNLSAKKARRQGRSAETSEMYMDGE